MEKQKRWFIFYAVTVTAVLMAIYYGNQSVAVIAQNIPPVRKHRIIIDAGHGGIDGGATSCTGILESQLNLDIALRLNDLMHFLGYETYMVRTTDVSVYTKGKTIAQKKISDLKERVRITNETENSILLSIHQNTFPDSHYSGAQVFYANTEGSRELASQLQSAIVSSLNPGSNRKCKKSDGIYLMEHITCTGILLECGFLSNFQEEGRLRSKNYQQKLCCVIAATVDSYLSNT